MLAVLPLARARGNGKPPQGRIQHLARSAPRRARISSWRASRNYRRYGRTASSGPVAANNPITQVDPTGRQIVIPIPRFFPIPMLMAPPSGPADRASNGGRTACSAGGPQDPCAGLRFQLQDHERKLREYTSDPLASDNKGFLKSAIAAGNMSLYQKIYDARVASLLHQIANFRKQLEECEKLNGL